MKEVSAAAEELLMQVVAWEMLGREDFDPKVLLRQVPLADLSVVEANIVEKIDGAKDFITIQMVELEMLYRQGRLIGDWSYSRCQTSVRLSFVKKDRPEAAPLAVSSSA